MSRQHQGHTARKRFGQHFLTDTNIIHAIVDIIDPTPDQHLVEIGPGLGALTQAMLPYVKHLHVIEIDRDLVQRLANNPRYQNQLIIHQADALRFNFASLATKTQKLRILGNLPYNISTPLIFHLLEYIEQINDMHFMLQKEVVERLCAEKGQKSYGKLSIMVQYFCDVCDVIDVPPTAFQPAPKVHSAMIRLTPKPIETRTPVNPRVLRQVCTQAFTMRRKTLGNNFKSLLCIQDFKDMNIDATQRPETLAVDDFIRIANYIAQRDLS